MGFDGGIDAKNKGDARKVLRALGRDVDDFAPKTLWWAGSWDWSEFIKSLTTFDKDYVELNNCFSADKVECEYKPAKVKIGELASLVDVANYLKKSIKNYDKIAEAWTNLGGDKFENYFMLNVLHYNELIYEDDLNKYNDLKPEVAKQVRAADLEHIEKMNEKSENAIYKMQIITNKAAAKCDELCVASALMELFDGPFEMMFFIEDLAPVIQKTMELFGKDYVVEVWESF